jgi:hypothetical protein
LKPNGEAAGCEPVFSGFDSRQAPQGFPMKKIVIVADHNDADYMTETTDITDEQIEKFLPLIKTIKNFKPYTVQVRGLKWTHDHNWPQGEYGLRDDLGQKSIYETYPEFSEELIEEFSEFVPTHEGNVHTIKEITVLTISKIQRLI